MSDPTKNRTNEDIQQLLYVFQVLENQQKYLIEQLKILETQKKGVLLSKTTLEGLKDVKVDTEILIPIGAGAFTKAKLIDPSNVTISISTDMLIEKNIEDGLESIQKQIENFNSFQERLNNQFNEVSSKLNEIRPQIESIYRNKKI